MTLGLPDLVLRSWPCIGQSRGGQTVTTSQGLTVIACAEPPEPSTGGSVIACAEPPVLGSL